MPVTPRPPFTTETAAQKARLAEDAWNSRDPARVALAYTADSRWRNRANSCTAAQKIEAFLTRKWQRELDYRLIKEVWAFGTTGSPCASPTSGTTTADSGSAATATRTGSSTSDGLMAVRIASINDLADRGERAQVPLAARTSSRRPSVSERARSLAATSCPNLDPQRRTTAGPGPRDRGVRRWHGPCFCPRVDEDALGRSGAGVDPRRRAARRGCRRRRGNRLAAAAGNSCRCACTWNRAPPLTTRAPAPASCAFRRGRISSTSLTSTANRKPQPGPGQQRKHRRRTAATPARDGGRRHGRDRPGRRRRQRRHLRLRRHRRVPGLELRQLRDGLARHRGHLSDGLHGWSRGGRRRRVGRAGGEPSDGHRASGLAATPAGGTTAMRTVPGRPAKPPSPGMPSAPSLPLIPLLPPLTLVVVFVSGSKQVALEPPDPPRPPLPPGPPAPPGPPGPPWLENRPPQQRDVFVRACHHAALKLHDDVTAVAAVVPGPPAPRAFRRRPGSVAAGSPGAAGRHAVAAGEAITAAGPDHAGVSGRSARDEVKVCDPSFQSPHGRGRRRRTP